MQVYKRNGIVRCSCEDASWRNKKGDILDRLDKEPCKHVRKLLRSFERIINEGIETAIAA